MTDFIKALVVSCVLVMGLPFSKANAWTRDQFIIAPNIIRLEMLKPEENIPQVLQLAGELTYREGFGSATTERRESLWSLTPVLNYDRNVNSGFAQDSIIIGGLEFLVDEEFRRQSAPVVGASFSGRHLWGLSPRVSFSFDHAARYIHAWDANYSKWFLRVQPCLTYFVTSTARAFTCGSLGRWATSRSQQDEAFFDIGSEFAYNLGTYFQSSRISLRRTRATSGRNYKQTSLSYRHQILLGNATLISGQLDLAEEVDNMFVSRERLQASATKVIYARRVEVGYIEDRRRGGVFLGETRNETLRGVYISTPIRKGLEVRIGGFKNIASNAINEDQYAIVDFTFDFFRK